MAITAQTTSQSYPSCCRSVDCSLDDSIVQLPGMGHLR